MKESVALTLVLLIVVGVGCHRNPEDDRMSAPPPPPAAMIAPITESMPLEDRLQQLQHELDMALIRDSFDDEARARLYRAEAITDRITESAPPFEWLAEDYDLSARLRQLQSLADRVVASIRRDEAPEDILADASRLRQSVIALREALSIPGGEAPVPLDSLLAGYDGESEGEGEYAPVSPGPEPDTDADVPGPVDDGPRVLGRPAGGTE